MSDYLALDWETHQLSGLEASATRQGVTVRNAFVLKWPEHLDLDKDGEEAGRWLKKQLAEKGISTRSVLLSLPRESVVVRRLTVPNAPDDELPALVQMQAATKSATPLDQLELDFLPQPPASAEGGREVLMCTMPRKRTAKLRAILEGAGLELVSMGLSAVATAESIAREEKSLGGAAEGTSLIIARHGQRVEITILQDQHVIFTHSTQIHSDDESSWGDESMVVAEVQRSMMSLHTQSGRLTFERAWLVGEEAEVADLAAAIEKRLKCETKAFQPHRAAGITNRAGDWPAPIAAFSGPVGALESSSDALVRKIDFLNPRKQRARRDMEKIRKWALIGTAAMLVIGAMGYRWWKVGDLKSEIAAKRVQVEQLNKLVKGGQPVMSSAGLVGEWEQKADKEMGQIGQLYSALPGTDLMYLVEYKLSPGPRNSVGQVYAVGRAKAEADVRELFSQLAERGIKVKPSKTQQSPDSDYPVQFTLDLELPVPAAAKPGTASPKLAG